ncbi:hypothetical protein C5D36_11140 [Rathayibacter sp. AY1C6]|uniref:hypothetical protein n=1 Tax=Rathayibacter sp. AY1C6 TaxID=2080539 RepID=UPI000CE7E03E|nr:hypothetical protein [Rathayibacter sp. AY1C6]PPG14473.1 hypothetical protein C5D36_11140 [Rathayibacter sp. AY1C6]
MTAAPPLAVVDERSRFAVVALGWRDPAGDDGPDRAARLRSAVPPGAVSLAWTATAGAQSLTAVLPPEGAAAWTALTLERAQGAGDPVLAVVGPERAVHKTSRPVSVPAAAPLPSALHQSREQGYESTIVTGADPSGEVGHAATFLALCRLTAGAEPLVPAALRSAGGDAVAQVARGLRSSRPSLTWQVVSPAGQGIPTLETVLRTVLDGRAAHGEGARAAHAFARANLLRAWRSPETLARTLVEYEVMGWGGALVLDPEQALAAVDESALERAVAGLVRPVADVVGWG